jgi:hypothetical protein
VLYTDSGAGFPFADVTGGPENRKVRRSFISQIDLRGLLDPGPRPTDSPTSRLSDVFHIEQGADETGEELARYGVHSHLESFRVAGIPFEAFVHPFRVQGLRVDSPDTPNTDESALLYMVGILSKETLQEESKELRLALVIDALLVIGAFLACVSLLWLWTAGDRLMLAFRHFVLLLASSLMATLFYTLFVVDFSSRGWDSRSLDGALQGLSRRMQSDFGDELRTRIEGLTRETEKMLGAGETRARREGKQRKPATSDELESRFACRIEPDQNRSIQSRESDSGGQEAQQVRASGSGDGAVGDDAAAERFPAFELAFLLDGEGTQWQCVSNRGFETAPLKLDFRPYFKRPQVGDLWPAPLPGGPDYFLEGITSILDNTTETVVSVRPADLCKVNGDALCGVDGEVVRKLVAAVVVGRFESLEEAILPAHYRFAVFEDATGDTLFH